VSGRDGWPQAVTEHVLQRVDPVEAPHAAGDEADRVPAAGAEPRSSGQVRPMPYPKSSTPKPSPLGRAACLSVRLSAEPSPVCGELADQVVDAGCGGQARAAGDGLPTRLFPGRRQP